MPEVVDVVVAVDDTSVDETTPIYQEMLAEFGDPFTALPPSEARALLDAWSADLAEAVREPVLDDDGSVPVSSP